MQFKLLQFYKVLSNLSTNLISAFIPLIVYEQTQNIYLSVASLILGYFFICLFNFLFKKAFVSKPELCLCLRVIPIVLMQVSLLFIHVSPIIMIIVVSIMNGLHNALKNTPSDILYNYSVPANTTTKTLGLSRAFEQMGYVSAAICGGLFLDYIPVLYVVIISLTLYLISSLPLMIYYIKNKGKKSFNVEMVSTAHLHYETTDDSLEGKNVSKKIVLYYFIFTALLNGIDAFYNFFSFATYLKTNSFLISGILTGACDGIYGIMAFVVGKLDEKKDLTIFCSVACFIMAGCIVGAMLTIGTWLSFVFYLLIPLVWPFPVIFTSQRLFTKSKILGITNNAIYHRYNSLYVGQSCCMVFGLTGVIWPIFVAGAVFMCLAGATLPIVEEKTRKALVDYIEDNV